MHEIVSIKQIVISKVNIKCIRKVVIKELFTKDFRMYLYNKYVSVFFSICFYARDRALMLQCHSHLVNVLVSEQILIGWAIDGFIGKKTDDFRDDLFIQRSEKWNTREKQAQVCATVD